MDSNVLKCIADEINGYKRLLIGNYKDLYIDDIDLKKEANMSNLCMSDFFVLLYGYFDIHNLKGYMLKSRESGLVELYVKDEVYDEFRAIIFKFAHICCSEAGVIKFQRWGKECQNLYDALHVSNKLENSGVLHTIYSSTSGGWNIKESKVRVKNKQLEKKLKIFIRH